MEAWTGFMVEGACARSYAQRLANIAQGKGSLSPVAQCMRSQQCSPPLQEEEGSITFYDHLQEEGEEGEGGKGGGRQSGGYVSARARL